MPMATDPAAHPGPHSFNEIFHAELEALGRKPEDLKPEGMAPGELVARAEAGDEGAKRALADHEARRDENLRRLYAFAATSPNEWGVAEPLAALCLSGGGIRSATFNLGVLQALARRGVLGRFDYLSSVSGGGYISSWLQAWRKHEGKEAVFEELAGTAARRPHAPESKPLDHLRQYSNYLTPRTGLFSIDTWAAAAIFARNVLLNWLLLIPLLAAVVAVPIMCFLLVQAPTGLNPAIGGWVAAALALSVVGETATYYYRRRRGSGADSALMVVGGGLIPTWLSATVVVLMATRLEAGASTVVGHAGVLPFALAWLVAAPVTGWLMAGLLPSSESRKWTLAELAGLLVSGFLGAALFVLAGNKVFPYLYARPALLVMLGLPILLGIKLAGRSLLVAWFSLGEMRQWQLAEGADYDREWWARHSGWTLLAAAGWIVLSGLALVASPLVHRFLPLVLPAGGISGLVTWITGMSAGTSSGRRGGEKSQSTAQELALRLATPVFCAALIALVGVGMGALAGYVSGLGYILPLSGIEGRTVVGWTEILEVAALPLGLLALSAFMGMVVNVNRFSLHGMYRNRLVRAYLGASRKARKPDRFTGFDPRDNISLASLWNRNTDASEQRPLPVYNAALNLLGGGDKLAWQQRKAESFSMSPLFVGNFHDGYRPSSTYAGGPGITLGTAVAVSGAAANPNMGYHSSPTVTFLLTLFNARLGAWFGNPGYAGARTFAAPGPRWALRPLVSELVGQTTSSSPYVNLSDGGHFDNLGLYEMVLRRCRYIFVSDAGQDSKAGSFSFEDLGNAVRKVRIDFGVPIDFTDRIRILPRDEQGSGLYCAAGRIRYSAVDGAGAQDGVLFYIKPAVYAKGEPVPYDVVSYARGSELFPHEPTADQWFDESQFESYRALGFHAVAQMCQDMGAAATLDAFATSVAAYMAAVPAAGEMREARPVVVDRPEPIRAQPRARSRRPGPEPAPEVVRVTPPDPRG